MNKNPNKRNGGKYLPRAERPLNPSGLLRLLSTPPSALNCRCSLTPELREEAHIHQGNVMLAKALFKQQLMQVARDVENRSRGLPTGPSNQPGSWEALEDLLGRETLGRIRAET